MNEYLTVADVAKILKKHPETIRRLARSRKINAFKNGNYYFTASDIEDYVKKNNNHVSQAVLGDERWQNRSFNCTNDQIVNVSGIVSRRQRESEYAEVLARIT